MILVFGYFLETKKKIKTVTIILCIQKQFKQRQRMLLFMFFFYLETYAHWTQSYCVEQHNMKWSLFWVHGFTGIASFQITHNILAFAIRTCMVLCQTTITFRIVHVQSIFNGQILMSIRKSSFNPCHIYWQIFNAVFIGLVQFIGGSSDNFCDTLMCTDGFVVIWTHSLTIWQYRYIYCHCQNNSNYNFPCKPCNGLLFYH